MDSGVLQISEIREISLIYFCKRGFTLTIFKDQKKNMTCFLFCMQLWDFFGGLKTFWVDLFTRFVLYIIKCFETRGTQFKVQTNNLFCYLCYSNRVLGSRLPKTGKYTPQTSPVDLQYNVRLITDTLWHRYELTVARVDRLEEFGSYSTQVNSARVQSIPKSTRPKVNSSPWELVPRWNRIQVNSYPSKFVLVSQLLHSELVTRWTREFYK